MNYFQLKCELQFVHNTLLIFKYLWVVKLNRNNVYKLKINIPPINNQEEILKKIRSEIEIINNNENLMKIFSEKINNKINKIWSN